MSEIQHKQQIAESELEIFQTLALSDMEYKISVFEWIHVYAWLSPFAVHLKLTQHCKSTILQ